MGKNTNIHLIELTITRLTTRMSHATRFTPGIQNLLVKGARWRCKQPGKYGLPKHMVGYHQSTCRTMVTAGVQFFLTVPWTSRTWDRGHGQHAELFSEVAALVY